MLFGPTQLGAPEAAVGDNQQGVASRQLGAAAQEPPGD